MIILGTNKRITNWIDSPKTKELIEYRINKLKDNLLKINHNQNLVMAENQQVMQVTDNHRISDFTISVKMKNLQPYYYKKGRNSKYGGKTPDTYFFCKELFFEFGCWLSVDLRLDLYDVVFNDVVEYRNKLKGSFSKEFTDSIVSIEPKPNYCILYSVLNKAVFGKNKNNENQRDSATEQELNLMYRMETEIITLIKYSVLKSFDDVIAHIQSYYK